ncbi:hypothetical protein HZA76_00725 [Candidatus Roizmanbacteria bacterium]|nr:hypothetical protein [Candidatus Roizmanbacteria bacterium]
MFIKPVSFKANVSLGYKYKFNLKQKRPITILQKLARMENIRKAQAERWG